MTNDFKGEYGLKILKKALLDVNIREMKQFENEPLYNISERHNERMNRLFKIKNKRRIKYYASRIAAAVLIVVTIFSGMVIFSQNARAFFSRIITIWFESFTKLTYNEVPDVSEEYSEWKLGYLPPGFVLEEEITYDEGKHFVYMDENNNLIRLSYNLLQYDVLYYLDNELRNYQQINIDGKEGYYLSKTSPASDNIFVWFESGMIFRLQSFISIDELTHVFRSISKSK